MASGITFWGRSGQAETEDALAFLRSHRYAADRVLDLARQAPGPEDLNRLAQGPGGLWPLVDSRHPDAARLAPAGPATPSEALQALLLERPELLRAPILLTPKGAVGGFREQRWRAFLDIGRGRA